MHPSRTIRKASPKPAKQSALMGPGCYSLVFEDPREWSTELDEPTAEHQYSELELSASRR